MRTTRKRSLSWLTVGGLLALAAFSGVAGAAAQCRDDKGKFIRCPTTAVSGTAHCRDKTTKKFAKCGLPNSEPMPAPTSAK